ncbi:hypothetical protein OUZ56_033043 [Daphnia magna]|uniref:Uncharacterized protein n=1 Tax=Daphnia magna TaxID=35525 RepID=A0ABR0BA38_9CRUS|nr:hypothetical protein OUZ56_033043 [Daphnia magna]
MKSRVGKSRVLTDTPEKDEIEQDYVLQQEKLMKSTKAKRALLPQQKEKCKSRNNQVQSESLTKKNETPIVCIEKKMSRKSKVKDNISNKENETPVAHVEKKKSRKFQVQEKTSNKENLTSLANSVICNESDGVCSTDKVQRTRSGRVIHQKVLVNYEYD